MTMSYLSWNSLGAGNLWTVQELGDLIKESQPRIVFLMETRLEDRGIDRLKQRFKMFGFSVLSRGRSGGLALLWTNDSCVCLLSYSFHHIDVKVFFG